MIDDERRVTTDMEQGRSDDGNDAMNRKGPSASPAAPPSPTPEDAGIGSALRAIYTRTVDEAIPQEMLDLLKRLD